MHLLSKHKFYASAEKLFYEFFSIVNLSDKRTIVADVPLSSLIAAALATSSSPSNNYSSNSNNISSIKNELISPSKASSNPEKITTLKRALIDANIIIPTSNLNISTQKTPNTVHINNVKKVRYVVDDLPKDDGKEVVSQCQKQTKIQMQYDTEVLDDGSTIFICSKCKLVFLKTEVLAEHKCMLSDDIESEMQQQNLAMNSSNGELHETEMAKDDSDAFAKTDELLHGNASNSCDGFVIIKNASDVIYIE